ncbi:MAG: HD domain-containing phosphohydrolase [Thermodesulfobacteriota bacterium]
MNRSSLQKPVEAEKENILFVDDEESILEIAVEFFKHKGYRVISARNGLEAMEVLNRSRIDCCFTDINMPEMDGLELAERIRKLDNTIPVIVMTGYPSLDNTIRTLKNGVVDFLIKPVNLNQMEVCVRRVLRERQLFVENILLKKEVEGKARLEKINQELLYKVEELNVLNRIMNDVAAVSRSADVYKRIVEMTVELTHADISRFYVINDAEQRPFEVAAFRRDSATGESGGEGLDAIKDEAFQQLIMEAVSDELPLLISNNQGTRGLSPRTASLMVVPMKIQEKVFGVLTAKVVSGGKRFSDKELYYLSFMTQRAAYAIENLALYEHINSGLITTLNAFVKAIEARDPYTEQHSNRVTEVAVKIGKAIGCSEEEIDILNIAGPLHDIGKIGIRDDILLKPGRLTEQEFEKIKEHPDIGAGIIGQLGMWDEHQGIIRHHHERYDGSGYPDGLKADEIPFLARILSVADAYDAMASDRAYRKKMPVEKVLAILKEGAGSQFDPRCVDVFLRIFHEGLIHFEDDEYRNNS